MIRALTTDDFESDGFTHLLWSAVEVDDAELARITRDELPRLAAFGVVEQARVVGFVAFDADADPLTIEYIAVDERARGRGFGSAMIRAVREVAFGRKLYAETDDDAVDFYRRLGFAIAAKEHDPRWPDRQRYACISA